MTTLPTMEYLGLGAHVQAGRVPSVGGERMNNSLWACATANEVEGRIPIHLLSDAGRTRCAGCGVALIYSKSQRARKLKLMPSLRTVC